MNESIKPDARTTRGFGPQSSGRCWPGAHRVGPDGIRLRGRAFRPFLHEIEAVRQSAMPKASTGISLWIGTALVALAVVVNLLVSVEHLRLMQQIPSVPPYGVRSWLPGSRSLTSPGDAWHRHGDLPCLSPSLALNPTAADEVLDRLDRATSSQTTEETDERTWFDRRSAIHIAPTAFPSKCELSGYEGTADAKLVRGPSRLRSPIAKAASARSTSKSWRTRPPDAKRRIRHRGGLSDVSAKRSGAEFFLH